MAAAQPATYKPPLPQALSAGVWALPGPQERAAERVSCREVRQLTNQLLDTGTLQLSAAMNGRTPPASSLAAFHRKLRIKTLRVQYSALEGNPVVFDYVSQYAATTGAGLSVIKCSITVALCCKLQLPVLWGLLHALPQLGRRALTLEAYCSCWQG